MKHQIYMAIAAATILCGCETTYQVAPANSAGVSARYAHGRAMLLSTGGHGSVAIVPGANAFGGHLVFAVIAYNASGSPVNIGYQNIRVSDERGEALHLVDGDQMARQVRTNALMKKVLVSVASGVNAAANEQRGISNSRTTLYTPHHTYALTTTSYDGPAVAALDEANAARTTAAFNGIDAQMEQRLQEIDKVALQTSTVDDQTSVAGLVWMAPPSGASVHKVSVTVDFAGDTHVFSFYVGGEGRSLPSEDLPAFSHADMLAKLSNRSGTPSLAADPPAAPSTPAMRAVQTSMPVLSPAAVKPPVFSATPASVPVAVPPDPARTEYVGRF